MLADSLAAKQLRIAAGRRKDRTLKTGGQNGGIDRSAGAGGRTGKRATVIGAGIVGVATALYLQRDGWRVTVMDPASPGESTSGGNAGLFALSVVTPVAMPGTLMRVPGMLLARGGSLRIRWRYLPRLIPWLWRFIAAATPARVDAVSRALAGAMKGAMDDYAPLIEGAGARDLIRRQGLLVVYRTPESLRSVARELEIKRRLGIRFEMLGADEVHRLVPALAPLYTRGILYADCSHTVDPKGLVRALAEDFTRRGGSFLRERATGFTCGPGSLAAVRSEAASHQADAVVLAAGAWSKPLARMLGSRVPLDTERGYHVDLCHPGVDVRLPVISGDLRFCITPMAAGLRLAGTVEFAGLDAPPDPSRPAIMVEHARRMLPALKTAPASHWMGFRPSMPDSLPVIGRSPHFGNVFFAFGHGHLGLTLAAVTGRAIADLAAGRAPAFDVAPFRAERFSRGSRSFAIAEIGAPRARRSVAETMKGE